MAEQHRLTAHEQSPLGPGAGPRLLVHELRYPANLLTLARLLLLRPALRALHQPGARWQPLAYMGAAMLTDALDGPLARRRGEVSRLGKVLDPLVDKLVIDSVAVALSQTRGFPWWATRLLIGRDVVIVLAALLIYHSNMEIATARAAGKATTAALTTTFLLYILDGPRSGAPALMITLVPFALSCWQYGQHCVMLLHAAQETDSGAPEDRRGTAAQ